MEMQGPLEVDRGRPSCICVNRALTLSWEIPGGAFVLGLPPDCCDVPGNPRKPVERSVVITKLNLVRGTFAALIAVSLVGCTDKGANEPKARKRPGEVTKIDLQTRHVAMKIKTENGVEQEHASTLSEDTEILINGRGSKLADVRIGDKVEVTVQKSKTEDGKFDIKKVEITRASDSDWKSTSSNTQPAVTPNPPVNPTPAPTPPPATPPPAEPRVQADPSPLTPVPDEGMTTVSNNQEEEKQDLTDLIYAQLRVRMEEALARREILLKEGVPQSDTRIAEFERQILRARSLLSEPPRSELLDDVTPPLAGLSAPTTPETPSAAVTP